jgi:hypothetical protein
MMEHWHFYVIYPSRGDRVAPGLAGVQHISV